MIRSLLTNADLLLIHMLPYQYFSFQLIIPHLYEFQSSLMSPNTCTAVLHIFLSLMTMDQTGALSDQLDALRNASRSKITSNNLGIIAKIVAAVGRLSIVSFISALFAALFMDIVAI